MCLVNRYKQTIQELHSKIQTLQEELTSKQSLTTEYQQLQQKCNTFAEKESSLMDANNALTRDKSTLLEKVLTLEKRITGLEQLNSSNKNDHEVLVKELKEELSLLSTQNNELKETVANNSNKVGATVPSSILSPEQVKEFVSLIYNKLVELMTQLQDGDEDKVYSQKEVVKLVRNVLKTVTSEYNNSE